MSGLGRKVWNGQQFTHVGPCHAHLISSERLQNLAGRSRAGLAECKVGEWLGFMLWHWVAGCGTGLYSSSAGAGAEVEAWEEMAAY